jgi:hypothetical protein
MPLSLGSKKGKKEQKKSFKEPFCSFCPFFASLVQLGGRGLSYSNLFFDPTTNSSRAT